MSPVVPPQSQADFDRAPRLWWLALILGGMFFLTEHDTTVSLAEAYTQTADEMEQTAEGGNSRRRICFLSLAGLGMWLLIRPAPRPFSMKDGPGLCLLAAVAWCVLSVLWSIEPSMTVRRLIVLLCCLTGALGLARQLRAGDLMRLATVIPLVFLCIGILAELRHGTFRPWSGEYRFSGSVHPNTQGMYLSALCLASFCWRLQSQRRRGRLLAIFCFGLLFLFLTKSRTSCGGMLVSLLPLWLIKVPLRHRIFVSYAGAWSVSVVLLAALLIGIDLQERVSSAVLLGREEQSESLTGRLPIWSEVSRHIWDRPFAGHGYDTFWTPENIDSVSSELGWGIRESHSSYVDAVLTIGMIGLLLVLMAVFLGMARALRLYRQTGDTSYGFLLGLAIFGMINGLTESAMTMPLFIPFLLFTGLVHLAFGCRHLLPRAQRRAAQVEVEYSGAGLVGVTGPCEPLRSP